MEIVAEAIETFEKEKKRFIAEMKKEIFNSELDMQTKTRLYINIVAACKSIDLHNMQIEDPRRKKFVSIKNPNDLLMAIGAYLTRIRNIIIKHFKTLQEPFNKIISEYEDKVITILYHYIK